MKNRIRVKVEQRYIDEGIKRMRDFRSHKTNKYDRAYECLLALAIQKTLHQPDVLVRHDVYVNDSLDNQRTRRVYKLSRGALRFIRDFDLQYYERLHPRTFILISVQ